MAPDLMHLPWHDVSPGDGPPIPTSVQPVEAAELALLAGSAGDVLEVGSAYGYSAVVMALAGAHVDAVDPHQWIGGSYEAMTANTAAYDVANDVTIWREPSVTALPSMEALGRRFGLVFVDGDHSAQAVRADVELALRVLRPGGVLAVHDYGEDCCCAGVREALDQLFPDGPAELTGTLFVVKT